MIVKFAAIVTLVAAAGGAAIAASSGATPAGSRGALSPWSTPAAVTGCASRWPAQVGFPASSPMTATGPGAIVCADSLGELAVAPMLGTSAAPASFRALTTAPPRLTGPFTITTTGSGQIVVAGSSIGDPRRAALLTEGRSTSSFRAPLALAGPGSPLALARAYLGDTAVASLIADPRRPATTRGIELRVQRHFAGAFARPVTISTAGGAAVTALDVTLDYRSDVLVVWEQGGSIWARELRANGRLQPLQRVGSSAPHPQLQALVSDDNRAIVSWASSVFPRAHVWMSISAPLVRFSARPRLLEAIDDPAGTPLPGGSLRLTRLSGEGVLIAWTGEEAGRHVVRSAAVGLDGVKPVATISDPSSDAVLADLATGPHGDAIATWITRSAARTLELYAARGVVAAGAQASFGAPEPVGQVAGGAAAAAAVAVDPASDMAIVVWPTAKGIAYAQRWSGP